MSSPSPDHPPRMTDRRYGYIRGGEYLQNPDQEPSLDELLREYMGATPPGPPPPVPAPLDPALYTPAWQPGDQVVAPPQPAAPMVPAEEKK